MSELIRYQNPKLDEIIAQSKIRSAVDLIAHDMTTNIFMSTPNGCEKRLGVEMGVLLLKMG